jgi:hypothetical protein
MRTSNLENKDSPLETYSIWRTPLVAPMEYMGRQTAIHWNTTTIGAIYRASIRIIEDVAIRGGGNWTIFRCFSVQLTK